ncbi:hypothetical protein Agabi119p4_1361 [Agaricus bisporus var. burnettii]|uniref:CENP-V/GFA domain-containing protein n=1 Tax=Agaricus bisporus var. burnettii TaxID=192524 RepID=A0A8H7FCT0_AGABI|nr:hypothetical protein Agabi119p4_1361 [Agaricus bisporus var. burnettii]
MQTDSTITPKFSFEASCFCGAASWRLEGEPLLSVYCHCTGCQRRTGAPFIHGLHFPATSFSWTHQNSDAVFSTTSLNPGSQWLTYRCQTCYTHIGAMNPFLNLWTLRAAHLNRDPATKLFIDADKIKPTAHIFYDTRVLDVPDGIPKWDGYENKSNRLELP